MQSFKLSIFIVCAIACSTVAMTSWANDQRQDANGNTISTGIDDMNVFVKNQLGEPNSQGVFSGAAIIIAAGNSLSASSKVTTPCGANASSPLQSGKACVLSFQNSAYFLDNLGENSIGLWLYVANSDGTPGTPICVMNFSFDDGVPYYSNNDSTSFCRLTQQLVCVPDDGDGLCGDYYTKVSNAP